VSDKLKNTSRYGAGAVIGALLALGGVSQGFKLPDFVPQVKPVVITKEVIREVPVIKKVFVPKVEKVAKVYRVKVLDDAGKVVESYDGITTFQFRIIGATLTDKNGQTFDVDGNISVEPIK
jgi:hypothetical protein